MMGEAAAAPRHSSAAARKEARARACGLMARGVCSSRNIDRNAATANALYICNVTGPRFFDVLVADRCSGLHTRARRFI
jgi:hypothetical protein